MSINTNGLMHLNPIPAFTQHQNAFERGLYQTIRECSDVGRDRNIELEDFYLSVLSYLRLGPNMHLVRFCNLNEQGNPFGSVTAVNTLHDSYAVFVRSGSNIWTPRHCPEDYKWAFGSAALAVHNPDFLAASDTMYLRTLLITKRP